MTTEPTLDAPATDAEPTSVAVPEAAHEAAHEAAGGGFADLGLAPALLKAVEAVGYSTPSPIQTRTIPLLLDGRDILGQAQTGTGKTAAFALPTLQRMDHSLHRTQALVLTPTRELALQVAEAFQRYAAHSPGFRVLPVYGGQAYPIQLRGLARGAHVVVGTPGRIMDHLRRGSLKLDALQTCVLDEADEMLRMGFLEDVSWILDQAPKERQTALFSATLPPEVQRIAKTYLRDPERVTVEVQAAEAKQIRQRVWYAKGTHKLDALTRILEVEEYAAVLVFVRTRSQTVELSEKLAARGIAAGPLSGDVPQHLRERTIEKLRSGDLNIVVATDVAARGLDVDRISHVINYDAPMDAESYVHRIGRTGRAGRKGEAILFLAPRERRMLGWLAGASKSKIEEMQIPGATEVNATRIERFRDKVREALRDEEKVAFFRGVLEELVTERLQPAVDASAQDASASDEVVEPSTDATAEAAVPDAADSAQVAPDDFGTSGASDSAPDSSVDSPLGAGGDSTPIKPVDALDVAAALAALLQGDQPFLLKDRGTWGERPKPKRQEVERTERPGYVPFPEDVEAAREAAQRPPRTPAPKNELFRIEVGYRDTVKPAHVVAVVCKEAELDGRLIGNIDIRDAFTYVELPKGMPAETFESLQHAEILGRPLSMTLYEGETVNSRPAGGPSGSRRPPQGKKRKRGW